MSMPSQHPSFLELDRLALGVASDAATAAHVTGCERCSAHVAKNRAAELVPAWVKALDEAERPAARSRRFSLLFGGLSVAAALCLVWLGLRAPERDYDTVKGGPAVGVYVKRAGVVTLWDGATLLPRDRIQLEVAPEEFDHVSVFNLDASGSPALLYQSPVKPHARQVLPKAWELDAAGDAERIVVMFSDAEISVGAAAGLLRARDPAQIQIVRLTLPKQQP